MRCRETRRGETQAGVAEKALELFLSSSQIQDRVAELAREVAEAYAGRDPVLVTVLKGGVFFFTDLARRLPIPLAMDFIAISPYGPASQAEGVVRILKDLDLSVTGRDVLVVEDIVDTGLTLSYLLRLLSSRNPRTLRVCVLLDKRVRRIADLHLDFVGFEVPDVFLVGYGLDYQERFRNLPHLYAVRDLAVLDGLDETALLGEEGPE